MPKESISRNKLAEMFGWKFVPSHDDSLSGNAVPECWVHPDKGTIWSAEELDEELDQSVLLEIERDIDTFIDESKGI